MKQTGEWSIRVNGASVWQGAAALMEDLYFNIVGRDLHGDDRITYIERMERSVGTSITGRIDLINQSGGTERRNFLSPDRRFLLHSYAAGDGAMGFCWQTDERIASGGPTVTVEDAKASGLLDRYGHFDVIQVGNQVRGVVPVRRLAVDLVQINPSDDVGVSSLLEHAKWARGVFRYESDESDGEIHRVRVFAGDPNIGEKQVDHSSTVGVIRFFLANEALLRPSVEPGEKVFEKSTGAEYVATPIVLDDIGRTEIGVSDGRRFHPREFFTLFNVRRAQAVVDEQKAAIEAARETSVQPRM